MGKRKTPDDYRRLGESRGFTWLGPEVKNTKVKTWWLCQDGHKFAMRYNDVDQGHGCSHCYNCVPKTIGDFHALASSRGFKCLEKEIRGNNKSNVLWECERGHRWRASFNGISRGNGCPHCYGNLKKKPKDYINLAISMGFKWIGPEVPNTATKTFWECEKHHQWSSAYSNIKSGYGCPHCAKQSPKSEIDYHDLAVSKGLRWEGSLPLGVHSKTKWSCPNNHYWESTYTRIRIGTGCPICNNRVPKIPDDYHVLAASRNFTWVGPEVANTKIKTTWECDKDHRWEMPYNQLQRGRGCPTCGDESRSRKARRRWANGDYDGIFQSPTSIEIETAKALDNLEIEHVSQYRPNDYSRIYDEFIEPNILIELHGSYWHGDERPEQQEKDAEKMRWAEDNGFVPIVFWEHEIEESGAETLVQKRVLPLLEN